MIYKKIQINAGDIDIKNEYACKKGKMLKNQQSLQQRKKAKEINKRLYQSKLSRHRGVSCQNTTSDMRLPSMHSNEIKNVKARCNTIHNMLLKHTVLMENGSYMTLEKI